MPETHVPNGTFSVRSRASGNHRTFRIRTWKGRDGQPPRVVDLLTGPNNTQDYTGFAFLNEPQLAVTVWRRFRGGPTGPSQWDRLAEVVRVVAFGPDGADHPAMRGHPWLAGLEVSVARACRRCNRLLTTPESVAAGIGPECAGRE